MLHVTHELDTQWLLRENAAVLVLGSCDGSVEGLGGLPDSLRETFHEAALQRKVLPGRALMLGDWEGLPLFVGGCVHQPEYLARPSWVLSALEEFYKATGMSESLGTAFIAIADLRGMPEVLVAKHLEDEWEPLHTVILLQRTAVRKAIPRHEGYPWLWFVNSDKERRDFDRLVATDSVPSVGGLLEEMFTREAEEEYSRRVGAYHPSSFGNRCRKKIAYERLGARPEKELAPSNATWFGKVFRGIMARGHAVHNDVQARLVEIRNRHAMQMASAALRRRFLREDKWRIREVSNELRVQSGLLNLTGSCDVVLELYKVGEPSQRWIVELKSANKPHGKSKPDSEHMMQVHCYMLALDIPRALIVYVSPSDMATKEFPVFYSRRTAKRVMDTIYGIERLIQAGELPERQESKAECGSCGFGRICQPEVLKDDPEEEAAQASTRAPGGGKSQRSSRRTRRQALLERRRRG